MIGQQHRRRYRHSNSSNSTFNSRRLKRSSTCNNTAAGNRSNHIDNNSSISNISFNSNSSSCHNNINNNNNNSNCSISICSTIDSIVDYYPIEKDNSTTSSTDRNNNCWDPFFFTSFHLLTSSKNSNSNNLFVCTEQQEEINKESTTIMAPQLKNSKQQRNGKNNAVGSNNDIRSNTSTSLTSIKATPSKNVNGITSDSKATVIQSTTKKQNLKVPKPTLASTATATTIPTALVGTNSTSIFGATSLDTKFYRYIDRIKGNDPKVTKLQLSLRRDVTQPQQQQQQQQPLSKRNDDNQSLDSSAMPDDKKMNSNDQISSNHSICSVTSNTTGSGTNTEEADATTSTCQPIIEISTPLKQQQPQQQQRSVNGDVLIKHLTTALKSNTMVTDVFCRNLQISSIGCIPFAQTVLSFQQHSTLTCLDLSYNTTIGNAGACAIASAISARNSRCSNMNNNKKNAASSSCVPIQKLHLDGCSITTEGVVALLQIVLPGSNVLESKKSTGNKSTNKKNISKNQGRTTTIIPLKELSLRGNDLGNNGSIHAICELLKEQQQTVNVLNMTSSSTSSPSKDRHNGNGKKTSTDDSQQVVIPKLPNIEKLWLSSNNIDNDAAQCLSEALVTYYHNNNQGSFVSNLSLDDNIGITDSSSYAFSRLVLTLKELNIQNNTNFTDSGISVVFDQIKLMSSTTINDINDSNNIHREATALLLDGTAVSDTLKQEINNYQTSLQLNAVPLDVIGNNNNNHDNSITDAASIAGFLSLSSTVAIPPLHNFVVDNNATKHTRVPEEVVLFESFPPPDISSSETLLQKLAFDDLPPVVSNRVKTNVTTADTYGSPAKSEQPVPPTPSPNKEFPKDCMAGYTPKLWNTLNNTINIGNEDFPINNENKCPPSNYALSTLSPNRPIQKQDRTSKTMSNENNKRTNDSSFEHMLVNGLLASNQEKVMKAFDLVSKSIEQLRLDEQESKSSLPSLLSATLQSIQERVDLTLHDQISSAEQAILLDSKTQSDHILEQVAAIVNCISGNLAKTLTDLFTTNFDQVKLDNTCMHAEIANAVDKMVVSLESNIVSSVDESIATTVQSVLDSRTQDKDDSGMKQLLDQTSNLQERILVDILDKLPVAIFQMISSDYKSQSNAMLEQMENGIQVSNEKLSESLLKEISIILESQQVNRVAADEVQTAKLSEVDLRSLTFETANIVSDKVLSHLDTLQSDHNNNLESCVKQIVSSIIPPDASLSPSIEEMHNKLDQYSIDAQQQQKEILQQLNYASERTKSCVLVEFETTMKKLEAMNDLATKNIVSTTESAIVSSQDKVTGLIVDNVVTSYENFTKQTAKHNESTLTEISALLQSSEENVINAVSNTVMSTVQRSIQESQSTSNGTFDKILANIQTLQDNVSSTLQGIHVSEKTPLNERAIGNELSENLILQLTNAVETSNNNVASKIDEVLLLSLDTTALVTKNQNDVALKRIEDIVGIAKSNICSEIVDKMGLSVAKIDASNSDQRTALMKQVESSFEKIETNMMSSEETLQALRNDFQTATLDNCAILNRLESGMHSSDADIKSTLESVTLSLDKYQSSHTELLKDRSEAVVCHLKEACGKVDTNLTTSLETMSNTFINISSNNHETSVSLMKKLQEDIVQSRSEMSAMMERNALEIQKMMLMSTEHMKKSNELLEHQHGLSKQFFEKSARDDISTITHQLHTRDMELHSTKEKLQFTEDQMNSVANKVVGLESQLELRESEYSVLEEKYSKVNLALAEKANEMKFLVETSRSDTSILESHLKKLQEEHDILREKQLSLKQGLDLMSEKNSSLEKELESSKEECSMLEQSSGQLRLSLNEANASIAMLQTELDMSRNEGSILKAKQLSVAASDNGGNAGMKMQLESVLRQNDIAENNVTELQSRLQESNNRSLSLEFQLGSWKTEWESLKAVNDQMKASLEGKALRLTDTETNLEFLQKEHNTLVAQHADLAQLVKTELEETSKSLSVCHDLVTQAFVTTDNQLQSVMIQQQISEENNLLHRFSFEEQGLSTDDDCSVMEFAPTNSDELLQLRHDVHNLNEKGQNLVALLNTIKAGSGGGPAIVEIVDDSEVSPKKGREETSSEAVEQNLDDSVDIEYMKNVLLSLFNSKTANETKALLPIIASVLSLNDEELHLVSSKFEEKKSSYLGLF